MRNRGDEWIIGQEFKTLLFDTYAQALCPSIKAACRDSEVLTQNQILKQQAQKIFHFNVTPIEDRVSPKRKRNTISGPVLQIRFRSRPILKK